VTDVANAIFEQADAIMLSGETTVGKYPVKCVSVFDRIANRIERSGGAGYFKEAELSSPRQKLAKSAVVMANELRAEAIVVVTRKGHLARYTSWMRPQYSPIIAICESDAVARSVTLRWGVTPVVSRFSDTSPEETIRAAFEMLVERGQLHSGNTVVVLGSVSAGHEVVDAVQMRIVE
jgi:pyruvate kinase